MHYKPVALFICLVLFITQLYAQDKMPIKFGHVSKEDFDISKFNADTTEGGVIIADVGITTFEGNEKGSFSLVYKHQRRIKIINKNGFSLASVEIPLYTSGELEEKLEDVKASTYNIEDGKVVESKLKSDAVFEDKQDNKHILKKFTLAAVKDGSILEYSYTVSSDFLFEMREWTFQGTYPRVWSEYETDVPEYFDYVMLSQGYQPFYINTQSSGTQSYTIHIPNYDPLGRPELRTLAANINYKKWVMKDVPAFKEEKYTSSINNHLAKIEFQLAGYKYPDQPYKQFMSDWPTVSKEILSQEDFGAGLSKNNGWMDDDMKLIIATASTDLDKARAIYYFVKNNIKCNNRHGIWLSKSIKDVFKDKNGSVAEVNMLLTAMLMHENLIADPVILSTVSHGYTNEIYPLLDRFNYLVCKLTIGTADYFLDATQSWLGFGHLPQYCYNGHARVINQTAPPVYFLADSLQESKVTNITLFNDDSTTAGWKGSFNSTLGYNESSDIREKIIKEGKEDFEKSIRLPYTDEYTVSDITEDNLDSCEKAVDINYGLTVSEDAASGVIYFNPMINEGYKENFFKSVDRKYPVEMPYKSDETYILNVEIPKGYEIDELPKSVRVNFNDTEGLFEYIVSKSETMVTLQCHLKFEKAVFAKDDYKSLRDFFDYIVKKDNEQFVFKKKK
jgi:hypothetical protein